MNTKRAMWKQSPCIAVLTIVALATTMTGWGLAQDGEAPRVAGEKKEEAPKRPEAVVKAIDLGLKNLLQTQKEDGSWGQEGRAKACTALSLMALMAEGRLTENKETAAAWTHGKAYLLRHAQERRDGYLGQQMYEHALATMALAHMWRLTRDKPADQDIKDALDAAVAVILKSQNPGGGWRYQPKPDGGQDTSVTALVSIALAYAIQSGVAVPEETRKGVIRYFEGARDPRTGGFSYAPTGKGGTSFPCTAGGLYAVHLFGKGDSEMAKSALSLIKGQQKNIVKNTGHYYYCHYYAMHAMREVGGEAYRDYYTQLANAMAGRQNADGSWGSREKHYGTPMAILVLSTAGQKEWRTIQEVPVDNGEDEGVF